MYHFKTPENLMDVVDILNVLYASELVSELQYLNHYYSVSGPFHGPLQAMLLEHANEERAHRLKLGEMIMNLGGTPGTHLARLIELNPEGDVQELEMADLANYQLDHVLQPGFRNLLQAIDLNLKGEELASRLYQEAAQLIRPIHGGAALLCEQILQDETHHAHELQSMLP